MARKRKRRKRGAKKKGNKKKKQKKNNNPKMINGFDLKDLILVEYRPQRKSLYKRLRKKGDVVTEKRIKDEVVKDRAKGNHLNKVTKTAMKNVDVTKNSAFGHPVAELIKPENAKLRKEVVQRLIKMGGHHVLVNRIGKKARLARVALNGGSVVQGKKKATQPANQQPKPKASKKKKSINAEVAYGEMEIDWSAARQYKAKKEGKVMEPESTAESLNKSLADYMGEAHTHRVLDSEICAWFNDQDEEGDALMQ